MKGTHHLRSHTASTPKRATCSNRFCSRASQTEAGISMSRPALLPVSAPPVKHSVQPGEAAELVGVAATRGMWMVLA